MHVPDSAVLFPQDHETATSQIATEMVHGATMIATIAEETATGIVMTTGTAEIMTETAETTTEEVSSPAS